MTLSTTNSIRPSPIAGSWYSADAKSLAAEIVGYVNSASSPQLPGRVLGLICPHAGYYYSGSTAGYAYQTIKGMHFDLCVVLSPLHNYLPYPLLSSAHEMYKTPLGEVKVSQGLLSELQNHLRKAELSPAQLIANDREHSLEIQLPFLQTVLAGSFELLPLMIRSMDIGFLNKVAIILAALIKENNVLLVASTDLSHFYPEETANKFDNHMLSQMTAFSPEGILQAEETQTGFACGAGAAATMLATAKLLGANNVTLLHHTTSAQASGDRSSVVGYGALAVTKEEVD